GEFLAVAYRDLASGAPHMALVHGTIKPDAEALVRVHEPTTVLDVLCEAPSGHSWSVPDALRAISAAPCGVLVLLNCQGAADHLSGQVAAWEESGRDTPPANESRRDLRTYGIGAQILRD